MKIRSRLTRRIRTGYRRKRFAYPAPAGLKYRVKLDRAIIGLVIGDRPTFQNFLSEVARTGGEPVHQPLQKFLKLHAGWSAHSSKSWTSQSNQGAADRRPSRSCALIGSPPPPGQQSCCPERQSAERLHSRGGVTPSLPPDLHDVARVTVSIVHYPEVIIGSTIHPHTNPPVLIAGPGVELETYKPAPGRLKLASVMRGESATCEPERPRRY